MAHRYFTEDIHGEVAHITGADAAHLARVLRTKPGAVLTLCDGAGTDYEARVVEISPQEVRLDILASRPAAGEPDRNVMVCLGLAKGERMDWAIQKSVELGATVLLPFVSANTVVKIKNEQAKNERYRRIAQEAAKQCGRGILPVVELPVEYSEMLRRATDYGRALFFYEGGGVSVRKALENAKNLALITGAEGGFTPQEAEAAKQAGCVVAGLGPRILRCETAPLAALAAVMTLTGNLE